MPSKIPIIIPIINAILKAIKSLNSVDAIKLYVSFLPKRLKNALNISITFGNIILSFFKTLKN